MSNRIKQSPAGRLAADNILSETYLGFGQIQKQHCKLSFPSLFVPFSLALALVYHCDRCRDLQWNLPTDPCCPAAQWLACKVNGSDPIFPCNTLRFTHAHTPTRAHILLSLAMQSSIRTCSQHFMGPNHSGYKPEWIRVCSPLVTLMSLVTLPILSPNTTNTWNPLHTQTFSIMTSSCVGVGVCSDRTLL